jgi:hypothetical protein
MMKDSPFIYGTTVSSDSFTNREAESTKLRNNLLKGINTTIISPRRWGKSSLVEKVIRDINKKNKKTKTVIIDLFSVSTEEQFLESFAREVIKASSNKWQEWMGSGKTFFKKLIPKLSIGVEPYTDFSVSFDWKDLKKNGDEVINLPETIAKKKKLKFIICLDEFQNLSNFPDFQNFEKKLRAVWQRQKSVTYCLYGSKRHMMTEIFNRPSKPFYRFGDIMLLQKIKTKDWVSFICKGFQKSGKSIDKHSAELICSMMKNHSWYVQQLSHYVWNLTHKKAGLNEINAALSELINANSPLYQKEVESISKTQLNLLKAVAQGETMFTAAKVMLEYALGTPRNVSKNKTILINHDTIHEVDGQFEFLDPAFELWFNKQYFNRPFVIFEE